MQKNEHSRCDCSPLTLELEMMLRYIQMYEPYTPTFKQQGDCKKGDRQRQGEPILCDNLCILNYFFPSLSLILRLTFLKCILCIRPNFTTEACFSMLLILAEVQL